MWGSLFFCKVLSILKSILFSIFFPTFSVSVYLFFWATTDTVSDRCVDAMVVTQTIPLELNIHDRYDVILSVDWLMLDTGVILFTYSASIIHFVNPERATRDLKQTRELDKSMFEQFRDYVSKLPHFSSVAPSLISAALGFRRELAASSSGALDWMTSFA